MNDKIVQKYDNNEEIVLHNSNTEILYYLEINHILLIVIFRKMLLFL